MPNGKTETIAEIKRILGEIKDRPEQEVSPIQRRLWEGQTTILTSSIARDMGLDFDLPKGWMLKITPGADGEEPVLAFRAPGSRDWDVRSEDILETSEGGWITRQQVAEGAEEAERWRTEKTVWEGMEREAPPDERFLGQEAQRIIEYEAQRLEEEQYAWLHYEAEMLEFERVFGKVFPTVEDAFQVMTWATESDENFEEFLELVHRIGLNEDTKSLLSVIFPEVTPEQIVEFFAPAEPQTTEERREDLYLRLGYSPAPKVKSPEEREERVEVFRDYRKRGGNLSYDQWELMGMPDDITVEMPSWESRKPIYEEEAAKSWGTILEGVGAVGSWLEKYAGRPWEGVLMETAARFMNSIGQGDAWTEWVVESADALREKYGWTGVFSEEVSLMWDAITRQAKEQGMDVAAGMMTALEWLNPAYIIPIGGLFGLASKLFVKVPILGRGLRLTAGGVQAFERGLTYPLAKPLEMSAKGFEKVGVKIGEKLSNQLIKKTEHLTLMELPASEAILKGVLVDNWMKRVIQIAARIPPIRAGIEKGLGWRILAKGQGKAVEDIVARGAVVHNEIRRRGINAVAPKKWELRAISQNPVKLFGFNKNAYSAKMYRRLLPEYAAEKEFAGTLEHVFTHHEMYSWKGMESGLNYVTKLHEVNTEILNLLKKEGVPPKNLTEDWWIHRVVEGKFNPEGELIALRGRPGTRGGRVGGKPSYEMHRKAPTMAEGIAWGIKYNRNPELAISTFIEEAFKKIADARFLKYTEGLGILPAERLAERFPEIVERALLTKTELADAAKFQSLINRAIRGEKLPEQTLRAMERRFPELGRRFRVLAEQPATAEKQLREILAANEKLTRSLQRRLEKAEAIDIEAIKSEARSEAVLRGIPDEQKLREAFKIMDFDDRLAFRNTMNSQLADIDRMVFEQGEELAGLIEWYSTESAAKLINLAKKTGWYKGEVSNLTLKQYRALTGKRDILPNILTKDKQHVRWEYALDEVATEMGYKSGDELKYAIEKMLETSIKIDDLKFLNKMGQDRADGIRRMLGILDDVDIKPEFIMKAEPGMPEAGVQKDIFGYEHPHFPKGKGEVTQISMEEYAKLVETWKKAGLPEDALPTAIKPKIEGVKGLEGETQALRVKYEPPKIKTAEERKVALEALRNEVRALTEARKAPYWQARSERAFKMEQIRQPEIGEGYLPQPFAGGRIYKQDFIDSFNKFFGHEAGSKVLKVTSDIAGIMRITKAALDFSAMAIQGLPSWGLAHAYLMFNPGIGTKLMGAWYRAFFQSTRAFFDPGVVAGYMTKNRALVMNRIAFGGSSSVVDYFAALQVRTGIGGKAEWVMRKIPFKPYHRAETSFFFAGEMVRNEFCKILSPKAIARGQEFELARLLDRMTGIIDPASLGVPLTVRQLEQSFVWFAPSYTRACLTVLADIFRGGYTGAEARKALGGLIVAGSTFYSGVQYSIAMVEGKSHEEAWKAVQEGFCIYTDPITGEVEWRPSGKFMTLKVGNYNMGLGGFWYGLLRLSGNINACINEVGEREIIDLVRIIKNGSLNKQDNPFIYWWYSRSSPFFGSIFELSTGKDFLGYPIETPGEYSEHILTRFEPIWMEQGLNWIVPGMAREQEIPEGTARAAVVPAELFGLRTFPESTWTDFYDKANELIQRIPFEELDDKQKEAWRDSTLEWKHLTDMQKANMLTRYPELEEYYGESQADSAIRNSPHWKAYEGRMEEERRIYYDRIEQLTQQLIRGEIDSREYREKAGDAGQNYGAILEAIARDPNYAEIYDFFDRKEAEDKYGFRDDVALGEFQAQILYAEDLIDAKGDYDWDERDRRVDDFIEKWGQDTFDRIQQYLQEKKGLKGLPEIWIRKGADTEKLGRGYWRLPYKPFIEMDDEDLAEGNIPAEYLSLWKQYQALETDNEREKFIEIHPELSKDWRAEYRKDNPEADAMLALWGYGGRLQTMEGYDLVTQWGKELGIPLEQMGLGLPPRRLVEQYFEYGDVVRETSGNSVESRLFRMEHPDWEVWAEENWGWKPPDDNIEVLRISVNFKEQDQEYDAIVMENDAEQREARLKYLEEHTDYAIARRQREAYQDKFPDEVIDTYVEYYQLPEKGYWRERFLIEHDDFYKSMLEIREIEELEPDKIPVQAYDEIYVRWQDLFDQYDDAKGTATARAEFRAKLLENNPEFASDRRRREAYGLFFPEEHIENYAEYYSLERRGMGQELFLAEHPDFKQVASKILGWEPVEERHIESLRISVKYQDMDDLYYSLGTREERAELLENNPDYSDARQRRSAYDYGFPDNLIDTYVEYYKVEKAGYEDDWFLMANTEFYEACLRILEWEPRDFSKVPTREVYQLYLTYRGLPVGTPRYDFRAKHPELDAWGVIAFGWKPIKERGEKEAEKTPWEIQQEAERFKELFD